MSGNVCLATKITSFKAALECFRQAFPEFKKRQAEFEDPRNKNFAEDLDHPLDGIAGHWHGHAKAHIRLPSSMMGSNYDMGLAYDKESGTWSIQAYGADAARLQDKLNKVNEAYARMEIDNVVSKYDGRYIGSPTKVNSKTTSASIQRQLGEGTYQSLDVEFDVETLKSMGIDLMVVQ